MKVIGVVERENNRWFVKSQAGERFELLETDVKDRMEGLTVRVTGNLADGFGLDMFDVPKQILVQHLKVV
jgi:hypothetical protein